MPTGTPEGSVLIVDYGSQLTQLIARRVRELKLYSHIVSYRHELTEAELKPYGAFIFSGGPHGVNDVRAPSLSKAILGTGKKCLGICYGAQLLASHFGGLVRSSNNREFGQTSITIIDAQSNLFNNINASSLFLMSHSDRIEQLPKGWQLLAESTGGVTAAITDGDRYYGVQFHPEAEHSHQGIQVLSNFLFNIAALKENWSAQLYLDLELADLKVQIGADEVLLALSGGVDSLVSAVILQKAIGNQLHCVFIDHGLLRKNEREQVEQFVRQNFSFELVTIDAKERFLTALQGVSEPEEKRKIIGHQFIKAFEEVVKERFSKVTYLAQGTIYPDIIESAVGGHVIKSHHNVGGLPEELNLKIVEPLRRLFKDEVRRVGLAMDMPEALIMRHPFPGPGLAIRILGEIKADYINMLQEADSIFIEELKKEALYDKTAQAFAVFLPVKSVGVMGDQRSYEYSIALRAVSSNDFMTARFSHLPWTFLSHVAERIVNEVHGINRVTYDITSKPPATIEWE